MLIVAARAGVIGLGGHGVAIAAPVAIAHGATSYQNNNQISVHPVPVVAQVKTIAPIAVAHAPIAVAHAPVAVGVGIGHGIGLGLH